MKRYTSNSLSKATQDFLRDNDKLLKQNKKVK